MRLIRIPRRLRSLRRALKREERRHSHAQERHDRLLDVMWKQSRSRPVYIEGILVGGTVGIRYLLAQAKSNRFLTRRELRTETLRNALWERTVRFASR